MARHLLIVDSPRDWERDDPNLDVVLAADYLAGGRYSGAKGTRIINLCRSYRYLSSGYYCSLLAEARGHRALPSVRTITDLSSRAIYSLNADELDTDVDRRLRRWHRSSDLFSVQVMIAFGRCETADLGEIAQEIFNIFPSPLLQVEFRRQENWRISAIRSLHLGALAEGQRAVVTKFLGEYLGKTWRRPRSRRVFRYDMAILHDPKEQLPPSNKGALRNFVSAGKRAGIDVDLVSSKDYTRLGEYDALFIRETTAIDHHTYKFAKKAEAEGMVVIDDPDSIVRCSNKVYLAEVLANHKIPTPRTAVLTKGDDRALERVPSYPLVLKIPDGSFSRGIYRAEDEDEAKRIVQRLFRESDLILAQAYLYTEFDWRVTLIGGEPLFACQYFMSRDHWQVVNHGASGRPVTGKHRTLAIEDAPNYVVKMARKAARLVGDGLYGVDLKQSGEEVYVIEINDNPNIDAGVEDEVLSARLYDRVIAEFKQRLDSITMGS